MFSEKMQSSYVKLRVGKHNTQKSLISFVNFFYNLMQKFMHFYYRWGSLISIYNIKNKNYVNLTQFFIFLL